MATTVERRTLREGLEQPSIVITDATSQPPVLAGQKILAGTIAMLSTVTGKVIAAVSGTANTRLLGVAEATYDATGLVDKNFNQVYLRGAFYLDGKAGDLPVAANIGGLVAINDNCSVKATIAMNDVTVKLLGISGNQFKCELV
ncbi:MAG: hypothetical protein EKK57_11135 [Proteobacteria bacterium]|nr:MAG: hypothetical protein EKK57_11135 [Pseudomonadota bacterium]